MQITLSYFVTSAVIQHYHKLTKNVFTQLFKITNGFAANLWLQLRSVAFSITCVCIELISTVVHFILERTKFKGNRKQKKNQTNNYLSLSWRWWKLTWFLPNSWQDIMKQGFGGVEGERKAPWQKVEEKQGVSACCASSLWFPWIPSNCISFCTISLVRI